MRTRGFEWITAYRHTDLPRPERKTAHSAGYDIVAAADTVLPPGAVTLVPTGLKAYMQPDEYLGIHIRSGLAVKNALQACGKMIPWQVVTLSTEGDILD